MSPFARATLPACLLLILAGCDAPILPGATGGPPVPAVVAGPDATPAQLCRAEAASRTGFDIGQIAASPRGDGTVYDVTAPSSRFTCTVVGGAVTGFLPAA